MKIVRLIVETIDEAEMTLLYQHGADLSEAASHDDENGGYHLDEAVWELPGAGAVAMGLIVPTDDRFTIEVDESELPVEDRGEFSWVEYESDDGDWGSFVDEDDDDLDEEDDERDDDNDVKRDEDGGQQITGAED